MRQQLLKALGLAALAQQAWTLPSTLGTTAKRMPAYNANEAEARMLQMGTDSECDVGQGLVIVVDQGAAPGESPAAYTILFDAVRDELCSAIGCNGFDQRCVTANRFGDQVCIRVQGDFASSDRSYFIDGSRELFDRTVTYAYQDPNSDFFPGASETATDQIFLRRAAGGFIQVQLEYVSGEGQQCPRAVDLIAGVGALSGPAAPFFGLIGLLCDNVPTGRTI